MNIITPEHTAVATAIRSTVAAITSVHGADCTLYALIGAGLLQRLGMPAVAVAGSAIWRVGPGAGDVISHAMEITAPAFEPEQQQQLRGSMFHAWIEVDGQDGRLIDLTTAQLRDKAAALDQIDGGHTTVAWAPDYLWAPRPTQSLFAVVNGYTPGLYAYARHRELEPVVFDATVRADVEQAIAASEIVYRQALAGTPMRVIGVDADGTVSDSASAPTPLSLRPRIVSQVTVRSYKPEVQADSSGQWASNALRFRTREEAEANVRNLARRWTLVTATRVVTSEDPPNYVWDPVAGLVDLPAAKQEKGEISSR